MTRGLFATDDGGATWERRNRLSNTEASHHHDARDPAGVYFGTNSGSVFASLDEGETWQEIARHMPTILAVEVLDRGDTAAPS